MTLFESHTIFIVYYLLSLCKLDKWSSIFSHFLPLNLLFTGELCKHSYLILSSCLPHIFASCFKQALTLFFSDFCCWFLLSLWHVWHLHTNLCTTAAAAVAVIFCIFLSVIVGAICDVTKLWGCTFDRLTSKTSSFLSHKNNSNVYVKLKREKKLERKIAKKEVEEIKGES